MTAEVAAVLGKCRAKAHALRKGELYRASGATLKAQVHEHRAMHGVVGVKARAAAAREKIDQRKQAQAARAQAHGPTGPSLREQVSAAGATAMSHRVEKASPRTHKTEGGLAARVRAKAAADMKTARVDIARAESEKAKAKAGPSGIMSFFSHGGKSEKPKGAPVPPPHVGKLREQAAMSRAAKGSPETRAAQLAERAKARSATYRAKGTQAEADVKAAKHELLTSATMTKARQEALLKTIKHGPRAAVKAHAHARVLGTRAEGLEKRSYGVKTEEARRTATGKRPSSSVPGHEERIAAHAKRIAEGLKAEKVAKKGRKIAAKEGAGSVAVAAAPAAAKVTSRSRRWDEPGAAGKAPSLRETLGLAPSARQPRKPGETHEERLARVRARARDIAHEQYQRHDVAERFGMAGRGPHVGRGMTGEETHAVARSEQAAWRSAALQGQHPLPRFGGRHASAAPSGTPTAAHAAVERAKAATGTHGTTGHVGGLAGGREHGVATPSLKEQAAAHRSRMGMTAEQRTLAAGIARQERGAKRAARLGILSKAGMEYRESKVVAAKSIREQHAKGSIIASVNPPTVSARPATPSLREQAAAKRAAKGNKVQRARMLAEKATSIVNRRVGTPGEATASKRQRSLLEAGYFAPQRAHAAAKAAVEEREKKSLPAKEQAAATRSDKGNRVQRARTLADKATDIAERRAGSPGEASAAKRQRQLLEAGYFAPQRAHAAAKEAVEQAHPEKVRLGQINRSLGRTTTQEARVRAAMTPRKGTASSPVPPTSTGRATGVGMHNPHAGEHTAVARTKQKASREERIARIDKRAKEIMGGLRERLGKLSETHLYEGSPVARQIKHIGRRLNITHRRTSEYKKMVEKEKAARARHG